MRIPEQDNPDNMALMDDHRAIAPGMLCHYAQAYATEMQKHALPWLFTHTHIYVYFAAHNDANLRPNMALTTADHQFIHRLHTLI